jgi:hypothetical protein
MLIYVGRLLQTRETVVKRGIGQYLADLRTVPEANE